MSKNLRLLVVGLLAAYRASVGSAIDAYMHFDQAPDETWDSGKQTGSIAAGVAMPGRSPSP